MSKHLELLKKLKALAERGEAGEAKNAQKILEAMLKKHNLSLSDIEDEQEFDYFFKAKGINGSLLLQIAKRVNYNIKVYDLNAHYSKIYGGNILITCTAAEFVEIDQMYAVYKRLFKKESDVFYKAFLAANDLLASPPDSERKTIDDLTPEEYAEWLRMKEMAESIKTETIRKQLSN